MEENRQEQNNQTQSNQKSEKDTPQRIKTWGDLRSDILRKIKKEWAE